MKPSLTYEQFLSAKCAVSQLRGFEVAREEINPELKPHTRDIVQWALQRGCAAIFSPFGMHKTATQLEIMRLIGLKSPGLRLIVCPLGVRQQFFRDAERWFTHPFYEISLKFIRKIGEVEDERTDPFGGLGTVPSRAVALGRFGLGCELNTRYWIDGVGYCRAAEQKASVPTLFDLEEVEVPA